MWRRLIRYNSRAEAFTLVVFGYRIHVFRVVPAMNKLLKLSKSNHAKLLARAGKNIFGLDSRESGMLNAHYGELKRIYQSYLLKQERASELARQFWTCMQNELVEQRTSARQVCLGAWTYDRVFHASTTAIYGKSLLETYSGLGNDLSIVEKNFAPLFAGLPRFMIPEAYRARENILEGLVRWNSQICSLYDGVPLDPEAVRWDPRLGSRVLQAQRAWCHKYGFSPRGVAAMDCGFLFALSTNAIPATIWMLMHILAPRGDETLMPTVMEELASAQSNDGGVDIARLMSLPLLQSIYLEVLRLYTDLILLRQIDRQVRVPLDDERQVVLDKGFVFCPVWFYHRDSEKYGHPPADEFYPARFLREDPISGAHVFTTPAAGQLFAYGYGEASCPGRDFAKQEILGAVASILLAFEVDFIGYLDDKGNPSPAFPGPAAMSNVSSGVLSVGGDMKVKLRPRIYKPGQP
ncbi:hypothetical protein CNMCM7691_009206 [Aspergillus felis]|uniref:Cytochrome P450 n=1 Tax=Aspergillus felis TaxID=1287682 RepID=A0A8H6V6W4_9EURO|nr:hypothetical protein CNMCM7691_009206 [Aspergillus felis]